MSTKKDPTISSEKQMSPFRAIRANSGETLAEAARKLRLFPSEFDRLEKSTQGLRYLKLLLEYCRVHGVTLVELKRMADECQMPVVRKAPSRE